MQEVDNAHRQSVEIKDTHVSSALAVIEREVTEHLRAIEIYRVRSSQIALGIGDCRSAGPGPGGGVRVTVLPLVHTAIPAILLRGYCEVVA